ncbi:MAG: FGGY family carbohydrate kinase [Candidatus Hodarchaeota archaeon]
MKNITWHSKKIFFSHNEISPNDLSAILITNQRASFTLWEKKTGKPIINLINWANIRALVTFKEMRKNWKEHVLKIIDFVESKITHNPILTATSLIWLTTDQKE